MGKQIPRAHVRDRSRAVYTQVEWPIEIFQFIIVRGGTATGCYTCTLCQIWPVLKSISLMAHLYCHPYPVLISTLIPSVTLLYQLSINTQIQYHLSHPHHLSSDLYHQFRTHNHTSVHTAPFFCTMSSKSRNILSLGLRTVPEVSEPIRLPLTGTLPKYLQNGTLYRQGPGRYEATHADGKPHNIRHWFDGFALVHEFSIDANTNRVTYRSKFISASNIRGVENAKKDAYTEYSFGRSDPCRGVLGKFFQLWSKAPVDPETGKTAMPNVNVTLQTIPGKKNMVARTDFNANIELDPDKLEAQNFFRFGHIDPSISGTMSAAHGQIDTEKGEFWNYVFDLRGKETTYKLFKVFGEGSGKVVAQFRELPAYIHSFSITEHYVVLMVWPMIAEGIKVLWNKSILDGLTYQKDKTTKFYVVSRENGGVVAKYQSPAFFCFHTVNAHEKGDALHIDLCKYENGEILDQFMLDYMRTRTEFAPTTLTRFTLDNLSKAMEDGPRVVHKAKETILCEGSIEVPRLNPRYCHKEYRYAYGISNTGGMPFSEVGKFDVVERKRTVWSVPDSVVGEPIFVPNPDGVDEDDGALLVVVLDAKSRASFLVVLDARSMKEVARATVPQVVPLGFHGRFDL